MATTIRTWRCARSARRAAAVRRSVSVVRPAERTRRERVAVIRRAPRMPTAVTLPAAGSVTRTRIELGRRTRTVKVKALEGRPPPCEEPPVPPPPVPPPAPPPPAPPLPGRPLPPGGPPPIGVPPSPGFGSPGFSAGGTDEATTE